MVLQCRQKQITFIPKEFVKDGKKLEEKQMNAVETIMLSFSEQVL